MSRDIAYFPRCTFSNRWEHGDIVLLIDKRFSKELDCGHWGATNWYSLHAFGLGYEGVERVEIDAPFPYIEGDMLGIGTVAVIGGPRWEKAFPEEAAAKALSPTPAMIRGATDV